MLGSSIIELWVNENGKEEKTVFTGDLGNNDIPLLDSPTMIEDADYLVMESTYGSRLHLRNDEKAVDFLNVVSETLDNGGTVVIPSFAVGRTQEILYEINKLRDEKDDEEFRRKYKTLMRADVYVDSPLAISATEVFRENTNLFEPEVQKEMKLLPIISFIGSNLLKANNGALHISFKAPALSPDVMLRDVKKPSLCRKPCLYFLSAPSFPIG